MAPPPPPPPAPGSGRYPRRDGRALRAARRDDALERVRTLTRTVVVGAVAAVGVLTAYVAHALPGHTYSTTTSSTSSGGAGSSGTLSPTGGSSSSGGSLGGSSSSGGSLGGSGSIAPATQAPVPTQVPQQTSTGSSGF